MIDLSDLLTDETDRRLILLSSLVAGVTALSLPSVYLASYLSYVERGEVSTGITQLYYLATTLSYIYILGPDTYREFMDIKMGSKE